MLHLRPDIVAMQHAAPGNTQPLEQLITRMREHGVAAVSATGVLGDPTRATADDGGDRLATWTASLTEYAAQHSF